MALFINGVGQDTFNMNGVSIDNLYVDNVLVWSSAVLPIAPNAPTNFVASDDEVEQITFSWTNSTIGDPTPTYDIREQLGGIIAENVTSPHTEAIVAGTESYLVRAVNVAGIADSNTDNGTSISGNTKPVITRIGNASIAITEGDTYVDQGATALDAEDGDITSDIVTVNPVDPDTVGSYTVTYNVTDSEGLAADEVTRSVEVEAVVITEDPPIYLMTEPLVNDGSFDYLFNSASSGTKWDGKLLTSGDTAWNPTAQEYPEDGTIDFGTNYADTQWTPPSDSEYTFTFIEDVANNSYDMVSINAKGDGARADVLYDGVLTAINTGLRYTPPIESVKLTENMSKTDVPIYPVCESVMLSQYTFSVGDTATITMTFNTVPYKFTEVDLTANNGTISNFAQDTDSPWIYTATFTPDEEVNDDTNTIRVTGQVGAFEDAWGNASDDNTYSDNYTVNTVSFTPYDVYINLDSSSNITSPLVSNVVGGYDDTGVPLTFVDSGGTTVTGFDMTLIGSFSGNYNGNSAYSGCFADGDTAFIAKGFYTISGGASVDMSFVIPAGTWSMATIHSVAAGGDRISTVTIDGANSQSVNSSNDNTGSHCLEWTGIVSDGVTPIVVSFASTATVNGTINAVEWEKTA